MFKGEKNKPANDSPERLNRLVAGTKLEGDLTTESNLRVDGEIVGNTNCNSKFVLGEKGVVNGNLVANAAELEGTVEGDINVSDLLILRKTAIIKGNLSTGRLIIEDGAQIGGSIQTGDLAAKGQKTQNIEKSKSNDSASTKKSVDENREKVQSDVVY